MNKLLGRWVGVILLLVVFLSVVNLESGAETPESKIPTDLIFRIVADTTEGQYGAGKAFAVGIEGEKRPLILTAIHIFGPLEESEYVEKVDLYNLWDGTYKGSTKEVLLLAGTIPLKVDEDLAVFYAPKDMKVDAPKLSTTKLKVGEPVWLVTSIRGEDKEKKFHRGYVVEADDQQLVFRYVNSRLNLQSTSGSPIFNQHGEVVGINVRVRRENGKLYGTANPAPSIQKHIIQALEK